MSVVIVPKDFVIVLNYIGINLSSMPTKLRFLYFSLQPYHVQYELC